MLKGITGGHTFGVAGRISAPKIWQAKYNLEKQ